MKSLNNTLRRWLIENNYQDVAKIIEDIMLEWKKSGNKQRRNWWDILAGDRDGNSRVISGREIPVLKAAQLRKGRVATKDAICRNKNEQPIPFKETKRWNKS